MMAINPATSALLRKQYVDLRPGDAVGYNAAISRLAQCLMVFARQRDRRTIELVRRREGYPERQARLQDSTEPQWRVNLATAAVVLPRI
jgi:hypothetical protein